MITRPLGLLAAAALAAGGGLLTLRDHTFASPAAALDGRQVFRAKGCAQCHTTASSGSAFGVGPDLSQAADWAGTRIPATSAEDYVRESVVDPQAFRSRSVADPMFQMPPISVSAEELDALVAYVLSGQR